MANTSFVDDHSAFEEILERKQWGRVHCSFCGRRVEVKDVFQIAQDRRTDEITNVLATCHKCDKVVADILDALQEGTRLKVQEMLADLVGRAETGTDTESRDPARLAF